VYLNGGLRLFMLNTCFSYRRIDPASNINNNKYNNNNISPYTVTEFYRNCVTIIMMHLGHPASSLSDGFGFGVGLCFRSANMTKHGKPNYNSCAVSVIPHID